MITCEYEVVCNLVLNKWDLQPGILRFISLCRFFPDSWNFIYGRCQGAAA